MHWNWQQASQVWIRQVCKSGDRKTGRSKMAKRYSIVTRCIAAIALVFVYFVSTSAILVGTSTTSALARGGGGRGGGGRGGGFRGGGFRGGGFRGGGFG